MFGLLKRLIPDRQRRMLRSALWHLRHNRARLWSTFRTVRLRSLGDVISFLEEFDCVGNPTVDIHLRGLAQPVRLRANTSDFAVFRQVFLEEQYQRPRTESLEFIVDAGANIGLTSVYLLQRHPRAQVIAIEPDVENFRVAEHNLRQFGDRCRLVYAGLWPTEGELTVSRGTFRDGQAWATQTLPTTDSATETVPARTLQSLLSEFQFPRIDLLKVDIEGAELPIFRDGDLAFLDSTRLMMVECHGPDCELAVSSAAAAAGFRLSQNGELTIATRPAVGKSSEMELLKPCT